MNSGIVISSVERIVCGAVSIAFEKKVCAEELYSRKGNIPRHISTARHFTLYILKDLYCLPYSLIARHCGMSVRMVMKNVRKIRELVFIDSAFNEMRKNILRRIDEGCGGMNCMS